MNFFQIERLTAGYGGRAVLTDISIKIPAGTVTGILGANGSGKSTLLKAVCGALPHRGACVLLGQRLEDLSPRRLAQLCGYVPQRSGVALAISVLDVVLMGFNPRLGLLERPGRDMVLQARQMLAQVGLAGREADDYQTLSEGQKQLCILARTLAGGGNLLLLDEPESALDVPRRYEVLDLLQTWAAQGERGVLVTLHDPALALNTCGRLVLLKEGQVCGVLSPWEDPLSTLEEALLQIYGSVTLCRCRDRTGRDHLVMLKEREA